MAIGPLVWLSPQTLSPHPLQQTDIQDNQDIQDIEDIQDIQDIQDMQDI